MKLYLKKKKKVSLHVVQVEHIQIHKRAPVINISNLIALLQQFSIHEVNMQETDEKWWDFTHVFNMGKSPKTLNPTPPIMHFRNIFY